MTVHSFWWLLAAFVASLLAAWLCQRAARGNGLDWWDGPDPVLGCFVPVVLVLLGIVVGLVLWMSGVTLTIA